MRISDYGLGCVRKRLRRLRRKVSLFLALDVDLAVMGTTVRRWRRTKQDLRRLLRRKRDVKTTYFNVNVFSIEESLRLFRFRPSELGRVSNVIDFSGPTERRRYRCTPLTATCIILRRLAYPSRWVDLELFFGLSSQVLSEVFWEALEHFDGTMQVLLGTFRDDLVTHRAVGYALSIYEQGAPLPNCIGFLDCTKIFMNRPGGVAANQRACYSGHKRAHCLNYLTITTPDGIVLYMYGPEEGRRHDITLYRKSGLDEAMLQSLLVDDTQYYVYGDPAFVMRPWLQVGFPCNVGGVVEEQFNSAMSSAREAVEWSYKDLKQNFTANDFPRMLKVRKAPIALMYKAAAVLWNLKVCLNHGGQVTSYFACAPPSIEAYLAPLENL